MQALIGHLCNKNVTTDHHQKYATEVIFYNISTLVNALYGGKDQFCRITVLYLFSSRRLWRVWSMQRRIQKLLTGGSRI